MCIMPDDEKRRGIERGGKMKKASVRTWAVGVVLLQCSFGSVWAGSARGSAYGLNLEAMAAKAAIDNIIKKLKKQMK